MTTGLPRRAEVLVVGAGSAGCVMARRLAEAGADVLLVEAGAERASPRAGLLDVGPASRVVSRHVAELGGSSLVLPRGRTLGGSGAVNGGYCAPATPADLRSWGPGWERRYAQGLARAAERLRPRLVPADPVADWVAAAFPGRVSAIAQARRGDRRVMAFDAWDPLGAGVRVLTGTAVRELRWEGGRVGGRCDGVLLDNDNDNHDNDDDDNDDDDNDKGDAEISARTVILCAGAIGTAELLLRSGVGPATGHPVGLRTQEHPEMLLDLHTHPETKRRSEELPPSDEPAPNEPPPNTPPPGDSASAALPPLLSHVVRLVVPTASGSAQVEVRPYSVPLHRVIPGLAPQPHRIGIALMNPTSFGEIRRAQTSGDGVEVQLDAHPDPRDAEALIAAVDIVAGRLGLANEPVLSTSQHLSGSAKIGEVVDDSGRVLDVAGLRVADASVFPSLPSRGPYYSVLAVAEDLAARMVDQHAW